MGTIRVGIRTLDPIIYAGVAGFLSREPAIEIIDSTSGAAAFGLITVMPIGPRLADETEEIRRLEKGGGRVIAVVCSLLERDLVHLVAAGVKAILWRHDISADRLRQAIFEVSRHRCYMPPDLTAILMHQLSRLYENAPPLGVGRGGRESAPAAPVVRTPQAQDLRRSEKAVVPVRVPAGSGCAVVTREIQPVLTDFPGRARAGASTVPNPQTARTRAVRTVATNSPRAAARILMGSVRSMQGTDIALAREILTLVIRAAWVAGDHQTFQEARLLAAESFAPVGGTPPETPPGTPQVADAPAPPWHLADPLATEMLQQATEASSRTWPLPPMFPLLPASLVDRLLRSYAALLLETENDESGALPTAAYPMAVLEVLSGRWREASGHVRTDLAVAERNGQTVPACHLRAMLAWLAAVQGDLGSCESLVHEVLRDALPLGVASAAFFAQWARGIAALGSGRPEQAVTLLHSATTEGAGTYHFALKWLAVPDLLEAYYQGGRVSQANKVLKCWEERDAVAGVTEPSALFLRCHAMLADDDAMEAAFRRALASEHPTAFELGRTRLLFGKRLRRLRRIRPAREELERALDIFQALGARPWLRQAQREIRASGARPSHEKRAGRTAYSALTPQEEQVVTLAGDGLTNRQIATALSISPRTVGYHLYKAYPKLNITSRKHIGRSEESVGG